MAGELFSDLNCRHDSNIESLVTRTFENEGRSRCPGRVRSLCYTSGTCCVRNSQKITWKFHSTPALLEWSVLYIMPLWATWLCKAHLYLVTQFTEDTLLYIYKFVTWNRLVRRYVWFNLQGNAHIVGKRMPLVNSDAWL